MERCCEINVMAEIQTVMPIPGVGTGCTKPSRGVIEREVGESGVGFTGTGN
jgi:hypothetical protein